MLKILRKKAISSAIKWGIGLMIIGMLLFLMLTNDLIRASKDYLTNPSTKDIIELLSIYFFAAIAICLIGYLPYNLIRALRGFHQKEILQYPIRNKGVTLQEIEEDFEKATRILQHVWAGERWTIYLENKISKIFANDELIWMYYNEEVSRHNGARIVTRSIMFCDIHKVKRKLVINTEQEGENILNFYRGKYPYVITEYLREYDKALRKDFEGFLKKVEERKQECEHTAHTE
jgi:hypothetical protein